MWHFHEINSFECMFDENVEVSKEVENKETAEYYYYDHLKEKNHTETQTTSTNVKIKVEQETSSQMVPRQQNGWNNSGKRFLAHFYFHLFRDLILF